LRKAVGAGYRATLFCETTNKGHKRLYPGIIKAAELRRGEADESRDGSGSRGKRRASRVQGTRQGTKRQRTEAHGENREAGPSRVSGDNEAKVEQQGVRELRVYRVPGRPGEPNGIVWIGRENPSRGGEDDADVDIVGCCGGYSDWWFKTSFS